MKQFINGTAGTHILKVVYVTPRTPWVGYTCIAPPAEGRYCALLCVDGPEIDRWCWSPRGNVGDISFSPLPNEHCVSSGFAVLRAAYLLTWFTQSTFPIGTYQIINRLSASQDCLTSGNTQTHLPLYLLFSHIKLFFALVFVRVLKLV